jgi:hypothetical protein
MDEIRTRLKAMRAALLALKQDLDP